MSRFTLGDPRFRTPRSYDEWEEMLLANRASQSPKDNPAFGGPVAAALRKRWLWLQESLRTAMPYAEASREFEARMERDTAEADALTHTAEVSRVAGLSENRKPIRRTPPRRDADDDLMDYATEKLG